MYKRFVELCCDFFLFLVIYNDLIFCLLSAPPHWPTNINFAVGIAIICIMVFHLDSFQIGIIFCPNGQRSKKKKKKLKKYLQGWIDDQKHQTELKVTKTLLPHYCCVSRLFLQTQNRSSDNKRIVVMYCSSLFVIVSFFWNNNTLLILFLVLILILLMINTINPFMLHSCILYAVTPLAHLNRLFLPLWRIKFEKSLRWTIFSVLYFITFLNRGVFTCEKWWDYSFCFVFKKKVFTKFDLPRMRATQNVEK